MSYRCRRCHKIGHIYKYFPLLTSSSALAARSKQAVLNPDSHQGGKAPSHFEENPKMDSLAAHGTHKE